MHGGVGMPDMLSVKRELGTYIDFLLRGHFFKKLLVGGAGKNISGNA
jgi:hypothetical protein